MFRVEGLEELERTLRELPDKVEKKVVSQALRKGLKPIQKEAKNLAPVLSGQLKKAIKIRAGKRKKGQVSVNVIIGDKDFQNFYPKFIEYGTSKLPANPFMRTAYANKKAEAIGIIEIEIAAGIEREAAKLNPFKI